MRILFSVLGIGLFAQLAFGQQFVGKQELPIYALVIRDVRHLEGDRAGRARGLLVLSSMTKGDIGVLDKRARRTRSLSRNFEKRHTASLILPETFSKQCRCDLLSEADLRELLERGAKESEREAAAAKGKMMGLTPLCSRSWKYFEEKFPEVNRYYELSPITFRNNRKLAIVLITGIAPCSGSTLTYFLRRVRHGWKIDHIGGGSQWVS